MTEHDIAGAVRRVNELFDAAPWLADHDTRLGGCLNVTFRDLFALYYFAAHGAHGESAREDKP